MRDSNRVTLMAGYLTKELRKHLFQNSWSMCGKECNTLPIGCTPNKCAAWMVVYVCHRLLSLVPRCNIFLYSGIFSHSIFWGSWQPLLAIPISTCVGRVKAQGVVWKGIQNRRLPWISSCWTIMRDFGVISIVESVPGNVTDLFRLDSRLMGDISRSNSP